MNNRPMKLAQMARDCLSKLETLSFLRMSHRSWPGTLEEYLGTNSSSRIMRHGYSTSSIRRYGLDELIPKSPALPVGPSATQDGGSSLQETREKIAQQHQTSCATVVGMLRTRRHCILADDG